MAYTVNQIKVLAFNNEHKDDFTIAEHSLFLGLAYCYECFRAGYEQTDCERLMKEYVGYFENYASRYSALSVRWKPQEGAEE